MRKRKEERREISLYWRQPVDNFDEFYYERKQRNTTDVKRYGTPGGLGFFKIRNNTLRAYADCNNPAGAESRITSKSGLCTIEPVPASPHRRSPAPLTFPVPLSLDPVLSSRGVRHVRPFLSETPVPALQETTFPGSVQGSPHREGFTGPLTVLNRSHTSCSYHLHSTRPSKHSLTFLSS